MQKRSVHTRQVVNVDHMERPSSRTTAVTAMKELGPVVYAFRIDDAVKIGWTSDLAQRKRSWRLRGADGLLAVMPGSIADEQAIHDRLTLHRHHGHEYYHLTPEVLAEVNTIRAAVGMDPLQALA